MKTTLRTGGSACDRATCAPSYACSRISPAVSERRRPIAPVAQNRHAIAQPTWLETQMVERAARSVAAGGVAGSKVRPRPAIGITTVSTAAASSSRSTIRQVPHRARTASPAAASVRRSTSANCRAPLGRCSGRSQLAVTAAGASPARSRRHIVRALARLPSSAAAVSKETSSGDGLASAPPARTARMAGGAGAATHAQRARVHT